MARVSEIERALRRIWRTAREHRDRLDAEARGYVKELHAALDSLEENLEEELISALRVPKVEVVVNRTFTLHDPSCTRGPTRFS